MGTFAQAQHYEKVAMWQGYMETTTYDAVGGAEGLHQELLGPYDPGMVPAITDHYAEMNARFEASRAERIRDAIFNDGIEPAHIRAEGVDMGQGGHVRRLAEPSRLLRHAVEQMVAYQEDAELAMRAIPELVKLLQDEDKTVVSHAAYMVHALSRRDAARHALVATPQLMHAVVHVANRTNDADTAKNASAALYNMSNHAQGMLAIFRTGGIPALIRLLGSPVEAVVFYATTTLHNLLMHQDGAKQEVRKYHGIEAMVPLLARHNERFLAILIDCLTYLTSGDPHSKVVVYECGGTSMLVAIMRNSNYDKLLYTTSRLLKVLSTCPKNKPEIIMAGGMQSLERHVASVVSPQHEQSSRGSQHQARLARNCLWALRNMSDAGAAEQNVDRLLLALLKLMQIASEDRAVVTCCAGVLSNLTCNNQRNKQAICAHGGVEALVRTLERHADDSEITEPALCALRHLTSRHEFATQAQNDVRLVNGFAILAELLSSAHPPVVKAALGLVGNLAMNEANVADLCAAASSDDRTVVQLAGAALKTAYEAIVHAHSLGEGASVPVEANVSMLDMVECACGALHHLCHEAAARRAVADMCLVPVVVHLLSYEHEGTQRAATGLLNELVQDPVSAACVEREDPTAVLTELLHSRNESVATYAAAVLYRLSSDKPTEYRQQLGVQMSSALYTRDDSAPWVQDGVQDLQAMPTDEMFHEDVYGGSVTASHAYDNATLTMDSNRPAPHGWYDTDL